MTLTPDEQREHDRDLAKSLAAYRRLMDHEIVPESRYWQGEREDPDRVAHLSDIITGAAARRRERERRAGAP